MSHEKIERNAVIVKMREDGINEPRIARYHGITKQAVSAILKREVKRNESNQKKSP